MICRPVSFARSLTWFFGCCIPLCCFFGVGNVRALPKASQTAFLKPRRQHSWPPASAALPRVHGASELHGPCHREPAKFRISGVSFRLPRIRSHCYVTSARTTASLLRHLQHVFSASRPQARSSGPPLSTFRVLRMSPTLTDTIYLPDEDISEALQRSAYSDGYWGH